MVRAKFKLIGVKYATAYVAGKALDARSLEFTPSKDPVFGEATPSATLQMLVVPEESWKQFELGKEYHVDFTPAA